MCSKEGGPATSHYVFQVRRSLATLAINKAQSLCSILFAIQSTLTKHPNPRIASQPSPGAVYHSILSAVNMSTFLAVDGPLRI